MISFIIGAVLTWLIIRWFQNKKEQMLDNIKYWKEGCLSWQDKVTTVLLITMFSLMFIFAMILMVGFIWSC